jgi:hypothetical protein
MKLPTIQKDIPARIYGVYFKLYCQTTTNYKTLDVMN